MIFVVTAVTSFLSKFGQPPTMFVHKILSLSAPVSRHEAACTPQTSPTAPAFQPRPPSLRTRLCRLNKPLLQYCPGQHPVTGTAARRLLQFTKNTAVLHLWQFWPTHRAIVSSSTLSLSFRHCNNFVLDNILSRAPLPNVLHRSQTTLPWCVTLLYFYPSHLPMACASTSCSSYLNYRKFVQDKISSSTQHPSGPAVAKHVTVPLSVL